jgi:ketosteroid isomerase-like protein
MHRVVVFVLVVALAGCSGEEERAEQEPRSPEQVVRAWSRALNTGDDRRAGALFALGARIEQGDLVIVVREPGDAIRWNRSLPCSGTIVELAVEGETATAVFELSDRPTSACDAPGARVTAAFTVRGGKIVLFRQLDGGETPAEPV